MSQWDLDKIAERVNIIDGLLIAIANIDDVVEIIKTADNKADAKEKLTSRYGFNEEQSDAILKSVYRNTLGDMKRKNDELINSFLNTHISPEKCTRLHTNGTSEDNKKPQKPSIYKDSTAFIIHGRNGARTRD